ncbi:calcium/sodium antiporter [Geofilum sp. OHC36d9]|uniref:calcium/sodium antiporter n=1 Tax=Geofilum sp. OHC36d9 TaxID=3458413 RepID=UPI004034EE42
MLLTITILVIGLGLLLKGGDWLVSGSSTLARRYGLSELVIGLTIVAFGTSAPELVVSTLAAIDSHPEIALGNVIGSNNFNLFIILGLVGILSPLSVQESTIRKEIPASLLAAILLLLLGNNFFIGTTDFMISRTDASILLICFAAFLIYISKNIKQASTINTQAQKNTQLSKTILLIAAGLVALVAGGDMVVTSAVKLARTFNLSEKIIGLTIVAAGTSLPELVTSLVAIRKKNSDIAIGNVIGSNIFNIFLIIGTGGMITPISSLQTFNTDLWLLTGGTSLLLLAMFTGKKRQLDRWEAMILFAIYAVYIVYATIKD